MRLILIIIAITFIFSLSSCSNQGEFSKIETMPTEVLTKKVEASPTLLADVTNKNSIIAYPQQKEFVNESQLKVNPDEFASELNSGKLDIKILWDKFKIESTHGLFDDKSTTLESVVEKINFEDDKSEIKVLKVCDKKKFDGQLIFFKSHKDEWIFCGSIEDTSLRGNDIQYKIIECGDKKFIRFTYSAGRGTGFSRTETAIYVINDNKLSKVLIYPNHEHLWCSSTQQVLYEYDGDIERCWKDELNYFIKVNYDVTYTNPKALGAEIGKESYYDLFVYKPSLIFYWDNTNKKFAIDKEKSGNFSDENTLINFSFSQDQFFKNFKSELKEIATKKDAVKSQWLENFITGCKDSKEKDEIIELLKK